MRVPAPADRGIAYARTGHGYFVDGAFSDGLADSGEPADPADSDALIARLAMRTSGSAWFYDDDGRTRSHEHGASLRARYTWQHSSLGIHLRYQAQGSYVPRWERLRLDLDIAATRPARVTWRGSGRQFREIDDWTYDAELQRLSLTLPDAAMVGGWQLDLDLRA